MKTDIGGISCYQTLQLWNFIIKKTNKIWFENLLTIEVYIFLDSYLYLCLQNLNDVYSSYE